MQKLAQILMQTLTIQFPGHTTPVQVQQWPEEAYLMFFCNISRNLCRPRVSCIRRQRL